MSVPHWPCCLVVQDMVTPAPSRHGRPRPYCSSLGLASLKLPLLSGQLLGEKDLFRTRWFSLFESVPVKCQREIFQAFPPLEGSYWGGLCLQTMVRRGWATQAFLATGVSPWVFLLHIYPINWGNQTPKGEQKGENTSAYSV